MKRNITQNLKTWKDSKSRKPLLLLGARQTGKTWILKEFGKTEFNHFHYFDFSEKKSSLLQVFSQSLNPDEILSNLEIFKEERINQDEDLIIFDEIQDAPLAIKSLKFFQEQKPKLHIACAGSLLGIGLLHESYPVGKVDYLNLHPMSFSEFLEASNSFLFDEWEKAVRLKKTSLILHAKLMEQLKDFWITGGMPEIVSIFMNERESKAEAYSRVRSRQRDLIKDYLNDFSKHAGKLNSNHIRMVFENIPLQLAANVDASVQRYMFKGVIPGKKGFGPLEGPISWLSHAGLIHKIPICNRAELPLKAFCRSNIFKLHLLDVGLLGTMLELSPKTLQENNYGITKGFFIESFVLAELKKTLPTTIYGWSERNSEIEFLFSMNDNVIPIEVKAGSRTKAKSLTQYMVKYNPDIAVKLLDTELMPKGKSPIWRIPLYCAGTIDKLLSKSS